MSMDIACNLEAFDAAERDQHTINTQ